MDHQLTSFQRSGRPCPPSTPLPHCRPLRRRARRGRCPACAGSSAPGWIRVPGSGFRFWFPVLVLGCGGTVAADYAYVGRLPAKQPHITCKSYQECSGMHPDISHKYENVPFRSIQTPTKYGCVDSDHCKFARRRRKIPDEFCSKIVMTTSA